VTLYDALLKVWPSPVVALNRAVAVAMVSGASVGLAEVQELERDGRRRLGRVDEAMTAYKEALELTGNEAERESLAWRLADPGRS
jgi:predicted RNA polymerase sigma factor